MSSHEVFTKKKQPEKKIDGKFNDELKIKFAEKQQKIKGKIASIDPKNYQNVTAYKDQIDTKSMLTSNYDHLDFSKTLKISLRSSFDKGNIDNR